MFPLAGGKERRRSVGAHRRARVGGAVRGASPIHEFLFAVVVVVVVVVFRCARARDEREHEGKEKKADGGETRGRHGSVECVRARGGCGDPPIPQPFIKKLSNQNNALKVRRHRNIDADSTVPF
jgi:hypothetical protein